MASWRGLVAEGRQKIIPVHLPKCFLLPTQGPDKTPVIPELEVKSFLPLVEETVLDPSYRQRSIVAQGEAEAQTFCPQSSYVHELGRLIIVKCQFSMIDL